MGLMLYWSVVFPSTSCQVSNESLQSKVAVQLSQSVPADFADALNVVYFPQLGKSMTYGRHGDTMADSTTTVIGFLVCVPMRDEWEGPGGIPVLDGWTFQVRLG